METQALIRQLRHNKHVFESLFSYVNEELYRWKPSVDEWCLLEILCHLHDEERYDFRSRIQSIWEDPDKTPQPINVQDWPEQHNYLSQDYEQQLDDFVVERQASINWLDIQEDPDWEAAYEHPKYGRQSCAFFLRNWLAHDYLHQRQVIRVKHQFLAAQSDLSLKYAGDW